MNMTRIGMTILTVALASCGGLPPSPSEPSALPSVSSPPAAPPTRDPTAPLTGLQPIIVGVSPNVVTTAGTWGTIAGSQFELGATVKIDNAAVFSTVEDSTRIRFFAGGHAAGRVDIAVANPGGPAARLANGYTYTAPDSFDDANGDWLGHADGSDHYLTDMRFTIENNALVSLSCGSMAAPITTPIELKVQNGGFSFSAPDGLSMSGRLDSMITSEGRVTAPGCGDGLWWADKAVVAHF